MKALFDTNILIDYLNGHEQAWREFQRYDQWLVSRITWMEVLVGARTKVETRDAGLLLEMFEVHELTAEIASLAVDFRKRGKMRLPDAIILATAHKLGCVLVTRNSKDFDERDPAVRIPYTLNAG